MRSQISISNRALDILGATNISSIQENTPSAIALLNTYEPVLESILQAHFWKFATSRAKLALDVDTPEFGYTYQFSLPVDFIELIMINPPTETYTVEGNKLLSDTDDIDILYVKKITDPNMFSPTFAECFAAKLAHEICYKITQSSTRAATLWDLFKLKFKEAKSFDSKQASPTIFRDDIWIASRNNTNFTPKVVLVDGVDYGTI